MSIRALLALTVLAATAACTPERTLVMNPIEPAWEDMSTRPEAARVVAIRSTMVVAPTGESRDDFLGHFHALADAFAASGLDVSQTPEGVRAGDMAAILAAAREAGADAVLAVTSWRWLPSSESTFGRRYFVDVVGDTLAEVDQAAYEAAGRDGLRYWYGRRVLDFQGRVVGAEGGETLITIRIQLPRVRVADPLVTVFRRTDGEILTESYSWAYDEDRNRATIERAVAAAFERVAEILRGMTLP